MRKPPKRGGDISAWQVPLTAAGAARCTVRRRGLTAAVVCTKSSKGLEMQLKAAGYIPIETLE